MNPTLLAAGLSREIIELDISSITSTNEPYELSDDETELSPSLLPQASALVVVFYFIINKLNFCRMLNRDAATNRVPSLRVPTMGVYVPNMYLTQPNTANTNGNTSNNENQHVLVGIFIDQ
jgi:hypothetical protein